MLSEAERKEIEAELRIMPRRESGCVEALRAVQRHRGWVDDSAVADVAAFLGMSPDAVDSVATFYNLVHRRPVGRHVIHLCTSVTCWMLRYPEIQAAIHRELGIAPGATTDDGRFTLLPIQCLGDCDHAPAMMVDDDLHHDLVPDDVPRILERYD
ncbi:MAG TPA: NADH-quinone oxidoreductase subunit NuoE [Candidatus Krumholzibacteria bacterium]|nr:NADH-quinone oxidoreductase subunit NuoE [Candidatus Krumholzibacteria bacterium]